MAAKDVTLHAGNSSVYIEDTAISGFDNTGSTWPGRIFGAGIVEYINDNNTNSGIIAYFESSSITLKNVSGLTYDKDTQNISRNPGGRIYGGGQIYQTKNALLNIGSTSITIQGEETALEEVYGGSVISGTIGRDDLSVAIVGKTEVVLENGSVQGFLVGGNNTNWFGQSVVGVLDEVNGKHEYAGYKFNDGSTHVEMQNGGSDTLKIVGANMVDYSSNINQNSDRKAAMYGDAVVDIKGGQAQMAIGGGLALWEGGPSGTPTDTAPMSEMTGTTTVNVSGGNIQQVIGASAALSYGTTPEAMAAVAAQTGTATVNITGGTVKNVIGGGVVLTQGKASLNGDALVTISGGTVKNVVGGGYIAKGDSSAASSEANVTNTKVVITGGKITGDIYAGGVVETNAKGTATVTGNAEVVFASDIGFEGKVYGSTATVEGVSTLAFGDAEHQYNGAFKGTFSGFDRLNAAAGSNVSLSSLTDASVGSALTIGGDGVVSISDLNLTSGKVTIDGGTTKLGKVTKFGGGVTLNGGALESSSSVLFTKGLGTDYTADDAGAISTGLTLTKGTVSVNDAKYNLAYAASAGGLAATASKGEVSVVFTGDLVNTTDGSVNKITVEEAGTDSVSSAVIYANARLDAVTDVDASKTHLVLGANSGSVSDEVILIEKQALGVQGIDLIDSIEKVTVESGHALTLVGNGQGSLITGGTKDATVTVGGILQLGVDGATSGGRLDQAVTVEKGGQILVSAGKFALSSLDLSGTLIVNSDLSIDVLGTENNADNGAITVGTDASSGRLAIGKSFGGHHIFLDPIFQNGVGIEGASSLIYSQSGVADQIEVGRNSYVVIGTDSESAFLNAFAKTGYAWGTDAITAAAYLAGPVDVAKGALIVDGSRTNASTSLTNGSVLFAANSLLVADVAELPSGTALITGSSISVDEAAKAVLTNVKAGTYKLTSTTAEADMWTKENIASANAIFAVKSVDDAANTVTFEQQAAQNVYGGLMQGTALVDAAMGKTGADFDYVNALLTDVSGNAALAAARFDAAMNPAGALGAFTNAHDRAADMKRAVRAQTAESTATGLWVQVDGGFTDFDGLSTPAQSLDLDMDHYGLTIGAQGGFDKATFGAAFMGGSGTTDNDRVNAEDDFDYYGLKVYGRYDFGFLHVTADAGVTWLKSDFSVKGAASTEADTTTTVYDFGIAAGHDFALEKAVVTPFVGVDVYSIKSDGYSTNHGAKVDSADATVVEFPIGARVAAAFETESGFTVKPAFDLAVIPSAGDTDIESKVRFADASSNYRFTFADDVRVSSNLSLSATGRNCGFGLSAGYDWGDEERSGFNIRGTFRYAF